MKLSSVTPKALKATCKYLIAWILSPKKRMEVWIISERPTQARDNGYCFFKYLREKHPEDQVYYLIDKCSYDYKKVQTYGNVVPFNSWKHYLLYCRAGIHISSHVNGCCPDNAIGISRRTKKMIGFRDVFIPHGVSYGISEFCLKKYADINLFICSGKPEQTNILVNYGYVENEVAYTGFPRLDEWHHIEINPRQIVLMPTWRLYLAQNPDTIFENTDFFKAYQALIQDKVLGELLEKEDLKLVFYLHNEMRKYVDSFRTSCRNIEVVFRDASYDIQELLKSSALLITDYSSVHFDFAYMNKPVIYYQFDKEEFFRKQYKQSFFDTERDGFGPVCETKEQVVDQIKNLYKNDFKMSDKYYARMRAFYQLYDDRNCERVYQAIKNMKDQANAT